MSSIRRNITYWLWKDFHERTGRMPVVESRAESGMIALIDPGYSLFVDLPLTVRRAIKAQEIEGADKLRWVTHQVIQMGVDRAPKVITYVIALSTTGYMIQDKSLVISDPLEENELKVEELDENESVLLVNVGTKVPNYKSDWELDYLAEIEWERMVRLNKRHPKKTQIFDLYGKNNDTEESVKIENSEVKKIIVAGGHGVPGKIEKVDVDIIATQIFEEHGPFTSPVEVHFHSCLVAGNPKGREKVIAAAKTMNLPSGSKIYANRITALISVESDTRRKIRPFLWTAEQFFKIVEEQSLSRDSQKVYRESLPGGEAQKKHNLDLKPGDSLVWRYVVP